MLRVWLRGKGVLAAVLLSAACFILSAQDSPSGETALIEMELLPDFPVDSPQPGTIACRALPDLHTQPEGQISVVVHAPAWRAGEMCVRVSNRTNEALYYTAGGELYIDQHLRAGLWRRSRYRNTPSLFVAPVARYPPIFPFDRLKSGYFLDERLPQPGYAEIGTEAGPSLRPGLYRACFRFWQGNTKGWQEHSSQFPGHWKDVPWQEQCSKPFHFPPR